MTTGVGLSAASWERANAQFAASHNYNKTAKANYEKTNEVSQYNSGDITLENGCTDGKDDGKIGFFEAAGHIITGAVKGLVNGIKGMFTDSDGNFSLLKTIGSVALAAVCIAFPAVGLAACCVGAAVGAVKIGSGVINAATAKTDGAAKDAWEQVGDGALTVGLSVAGAKASYGAVTKSAGADSAINAMKASGEWENATNIQKVSALGKDMVVSTKNSAATAKAGLAETKEAVEIAKLRGKVSKIDTASALTDEEVALINKLNAHEAFASEGAKIKAAKLENATNFNEVKEAAEITRLRAKVAKIDTSSVLTDEEIALINKLDAHEAFATEGTKVKLANAEKLSPNNIKAAANEAVNKTNTGKYFNENYTKLSEGGIKNVFKNAKANAKSVKLTQVAKNLSKDGKAVLEYLKSPDATYYGAVNKYGYANVLEALEAVAAVEYNNYETI